ncbi:MAG TPA: GTP 3',8-cyclase MoaA [Candidatus Polarisedimenticolaceae bacterium]|nr:GTP 3',8-cyclase MoaA [Candidatus Polarisedimenticolaceae bacterium]
MLKDGFGRVHDDLRLSVTDRCNLRCAYCMPEDPVWFPRARMLTFEEILRVVAVLAAAGVRKVRLTGGEPLVRRDLPVLIRMLAEVPGVEDLSLTTNGVLLARHATALAEAGLRRVNVSLDTLRPDRFARLTGRMRLPEVLAGLTAAADAGLTPIKLNAVLLRGENDDEAEALVEMGRERGFEVRFIEVMPLDNHAAWDPSRVVSGAELRRRIGARWPLVPELPADPSAPASAYRFTDGRGRVGFIDSVTRPFCGDCSRLRLTSDGRVRVCLYDDREVDLREPLRTGADDETLLGLVRGALAGKGRGGALDLLQTRRPPVLGRTMHQIGG